MIDLRQGHVLDVLAELPEESAQCIVTSPPYWGLRDYGIEPQVWGGEANCEHEWASSDLLRRSNDGGDNGRKQVTNAGSIGRDTPSAYASCKCGAWRGSYGLEPTIELYIEHTLMVLRALRRVLRRDGVCFWNIGDSYAQGVGSARGLPYKRHSAMKSGLWEGTTKAKRDLGNDGAIKDGHGLKPKDLCLIPFRVALAAQADGWWVRSVIIWSKRNPMPESVSDRPTTSHEYILMLTKSERYFWDQEAVREPHTREWGNGKCGGSLVNAPRYRENSLERGAQGEHRGDGPPRQNPSGRNLRTVWEFATQPYPEAHFATYPEELVRRCILAGTSEEGCCSKCGKPWRRVVEKKSNYEKREAAHAPLSEPSKVDSTGWRPPTITDNGFAPSCDCGAESKPCLVLDPFAGSGTTLAMAKSLGRDAIGIELKPEYAELAQRRINAEPMPLPLAEHSTKGTPCPK